MCFALSSSEQPVIQISESDSLTQFRLDQKLKTAENGIVQNLKTLHFRTSKTNQFLSLHKQLKCPELYHLAFNVSQNETTTKQKQKYSRKIYYYYYCYCCWTKKTIHITIIFLKLQNFFMLQNMYVVKPLHYQKEILVIQSLCQTHDISSKLYKQCINTPLVQGKRASTKLEFRFAFPAFLFCFLDLRKWPLFQASPFVCV